MEQKQKYVETISGINVANGVVKIYFINEDEKNLANGIDDSINTSSNQNSSKSSNDNNNNTQKVFMKHDHTLIMPISGFMYMVSVIKNLLDNEKMQEQIEKYIEAGLLPKLNSDDQTNQDDHIYEHYDEEGQDYNEDIKNSEEQEIRKKINQDLTERLNQEAANHKYSTNLFPQNQKK